MSIVLCVTPNRVPQEQTAEQDIQEAKEDEYVTFTNTHIAICILLCWYFTLETSNYAQKVTFSLISWNC